MGGTGREMAIGDGRGMGRDGTGEGGRKGRDRTGDGRGRERNGRDEDER